MEKALHREQGRAAEYRAMLPLLSLPSATGAWLTVSHRDTGSRSQRALALSKAHASCLWTYTECGAVCVLACANLLAAPKRPGLCLLGNPRTGASLAWPLVWVSKGDIEDKRASSG